MTIAEAEGRRTISRTCLNAELLEGREAPGGWGGWDCSSWGWQGGGNHRWDSGWSQRGSWDCDGNKHWQPNTDHSCRDNSGGSSTGSCKPSPCKPPTTSTSQMSGVVYVDANLDAMYNVGEQLLPGVSVTLTGTTTGGVVVNTTVTTDANGAYSFGSLAAGNYNLSIVTPDNYESGHSQVGTFGGTPGGNTTTNIPVPTGQTSAGYNFGVEVPVPH